jgi:hypothetical protein
MLSDRSDQRKIVDPDRAVTPATIVVRRLGHLEEVQGVSVVRKAVAKHNQVIQTRKVEGERRSSRGK